MSHITKMNINTLKMKFKYLKTKGRKTKTKIQTTNEIKKKKYKIELFLSPKFLINGCVLMRFIIYKFPVISYNTPLIFYIYLLF